MHRTECRRLVDVDIVTRMCHEEEGRRIVITPLIDLEEQLGPAGIDLRLGPAFVVTETSSYTHLDPLAAEDHRGGGGKSRTIKRVHPEEPFVFHPGQLVIASTLEYVKLPPDIAGEIKGRSTWGREGVLVHLTADEIHPGSASVITFELLNAGPVPIQLYTGMRISQLIFFDLGCSPLRVYADRDKNKYARKLSPSKGHFWKDKEFAKYREAIQKRRSL